MAYRYIFKKDWQMRYPDGLIRVFYAGDFANGLTYGKIVELVKKRFLVPIEEKPTRYERKSVQIQSS